MKLLLLLILITAVYCQDGQKLTTINSAAGRPSTVASLDDGVSRIKSLLNSGSVASLPLAVNQFLALKSLGCKQKQDYINRVTVLVREKFASNEQEIKKLQNPEVIISSNSSSVQGEGDLKDLLISLKNALIQKNYDAELKLRLAEQKLISDNVTKFTEQTNQYLNQIKQLKAQANIQADTSKEDAALDKLKVQLSGVQKTISQLMSRRDELHGNMTKAKVDILNQQIASRQNQSKKKLEADFRDYSQQALQADQKAREKEDEQSKLETQLRLKQFSSTPYDDDITRTNQELDLRKSSNTQRTINILLDNNRVLNTNVKLIDDKITELNYGCLAS